MTIKQDNGTKGLLGLGQFGEAVKHELKDVNMIKHVREVIKSGNQVGCSQDLNLVMILRILTHAAVLGTRLRLRISFLLSSGIIAFSPLPTFSSPSINISELLEVTRRVALSCPRVWQSPSRSWLTVWAIILSWYVSAAFVYERKFTDLQLDPRRL